MLAHPTQDHFTRLQQGYMLFTETKVHKYVSLPVFLIARWAPGLICTLETRPRLPAPWFAHVFCSVSDISLRGILTPMFAVSPAGFPSGTAHQPTCSIISCSPWRAEVHPWIMISDPTVVGWSTCTMAFPSTRNLSYFLQFSLTLRSCWSTIVTI